MSEDPESLQGGSTGVTKVGGRVLRVRRQGNTNVGWLLTVLERRGFRHSPRLLGLSGDDRQILESIESQAGAYPLPEELRHDEALVSAVRVPCLLHEVTSKLATEVLNGWMLEAVEPHEVICHGDFVPYNCVFDGNRLVGIIGLDTAHPGPRIRDIVYAIYRFVPLTAPENAVGFGSLAEQVRRARLFCDGYGEVNRSGIIEVMYRRLLGLVRCMRAQAVQGDTVFQSHLDDGHDTLYLRDIHYLRTNVAAFIRVLTQGS